MTATSHSDLPFPSPARSYDVKCIWFLRRPEISSHQLSASARLRGMTGLVQGSEVAAQMHN